MSRAITPRRKAGAAFLVQLTGNRPSDGVHNATVRRAIVMKPPERLSAYLATTTGHEFRWDLELDASDRATRELERLQRVAKVHRPTDSTQFEGATVGMRFDRGRFVQFEAVSPPRQAPPADRAKEATDSSNTEGGE